MAAWNIEERPAPEPCNGVCPAQPSRPNEVGAASSQNRLSLLTRPSLLSSLSLSVLYLLSLLSFCSRSALALLSLC